MTGDNDQTKRPDSNKHLAALLFSDIVGSVALQSQLGTEAYTRYVHAHDEIFHECLGQIPGARILNETGDGFLVGLPTPSDAVITALRMQHLFHSARAEGQAIRIRIGLHLGVITDMEDRVRKETRAVGMPINLAARIMDLADGGQILMSRAVYDDARQFVRTNPVASADTPSPELLWLAHGTYEIKGADEPLEVFEVGIPTIAPLRPPAGSRKAAPVGASRSAGPDEASDPEHPAPDNSDVIINYAPIDNHPLSAERRGWISQFHRNLEVRVEQLCGRRLKIWRPSSSSPNSPVVEPDPRLVASLVGAKAMVSVLSPPFVHSESCVRDLELFCDAAQRHGNLYLDGRTRMLKVVKTPVEGDHLPPRLREIVNQLFSFDFFETDPETGRVREYAEASGPAGEQRFHERVYDLAQELNGVLKALDEEGATRLMGKNTRTVYLATGSSDITPIRDGIRRELIGRGHRVLPDRPLPLVATEFEETVRRCLESCDLAIHPVGAHYGVVPEGSLQSVSELQNRLAVERSETTGLPRIIWMPKDVHTNDPRQGMFLKDLQTDPTSHRNAEIVIDTLETLKAIVLSKLNPKPKPAPAKPASRARRIYLICDRQDEQAAEPLEDFLFEQGFEVSLPDFEADDVEAAETHRQHLCDCDGVVIFYGAARGAWVDIKLRNILKADGYGRERPLSFSAVYIAPPFDRRKERFRTHNAEIIRQPNQFDPAVIQPLLNQLGDSP